MIIIHLVIALLLLPQITNSHNPLYFYECLITDSTPFKQKPLIDPSIPREAYVINPERAKIIAEGFINVTSGVPRSAYVGDITPLYAYRGTLEAYEAQIMNAGRDTGSVLIGVSPTRIIIASYGISDGNLSSLTALKQVYQERFGKPLPEEGVRFLYAGLGKVAVEVLIGCRSHIVVTDKAIDDELFFKSSYMLDINYYEATNMTKEAFIQSRIERIRYFIEQSDKVFQYR